MYAIFSQLNSCPTVPLALYFIQFYTSHYHDCRWQSPENIHCGDGVISDDRLLVISISQMFILLRSLAPVTCFLFFVLGGQQSRRKNVKTFHTPIAL